MNRLTRRRKMIIAGCVFAAVLVGVACTGQVQAATTDVTILAVADHLLVGSTEWTWSASSGDLNRVPPLGAGQEVITGVYHESLLSNGFTVYGATRSLNNTDVIQFSTAKEYRSSGLGSYEESLMVFSVGSAANGATCDSASSDDSGNYTATPYYERMIASTVFSTDNLTYRSQGRISQADLELPDSMDFAAIGSGSGTGTFRVDSMNMAGIGPTFDLGSENSMDEWITAAGEFQIGAEVRWASFREAFGEGEG